MIEIFSSLYGTDWQLVESLLVIGSCLLLGLATIATLVVYR